MVDACRERERRAQTCRLSMTRGTSLLWGTEQASLQNGGLALPKMNHGENKAAVLINPPTTAPCRNVHLTLSPSDLSAKRNFSSDRVKKRKDDERSDIYQNCCFPRA